MNVDLEIKKELSSCLNSVSEDMNCVKKLIKELLFSKLEIIEFLDFVNFIKQVINFFLVSKINIIEDCKYPDIGFFLIQNIYKKIMEFIYDDKKKKDLLFLKNCEKFLIISKYPREKIHQLRFLLISILIEKKMYKQAIGYIEEYYFFNHHDIDLDSKIKIFERLLICYHHLNTMEEDKNKTVQTILLLSSFYNQNGNTERAKALLQKYSNLYKQSIPLKKQLIQFQEGKQLIQSYLELSNLYKNENYLDECLVILNKILIIDNSLFDVHEEIKNIYLIQKKFNLFCLKGVENSNLIKDENEKINYLLRIIEKDEINNTYVRKKLIDILIKRQDTKNYLKLIKVDSTNKEFHPISLELLFKELLNNQSQIENLKKKYDKIFKSQDEMKKQINMLKDKQSSQERKQIFLENDFNHFKSLNDLATYSLFEDRLSILTIPARNFKFGNFIDSPYGFISGIEWFLRLYPKGISEKENKYCGCYLHVHPEEKRSIKASYSVSLCTVNNSQSGIIEIPNASTSFVTKIFDNSKKQGGWGVPNLCKVDFLYKNYFPLGKEQVWKFKVRIKTLEIINKK